MLAMVVEWRKVTVRGLLSPSLFNMCYQIDAGWPFFFQGLKIPLNWGNVQLNIKLLCLSARKVLEVFTYVWYMFVPSLYLYWGWKTSEVDYYYAYMPPWYGVTYCRYVLCILERALKHIFLLEWVDRISQSPWPDVTLLTKKCQPLLRVLCQLSADQHAFAIFGSWMTSVYD